MSCKVTQQPCVVVCSLDDKYAKDSMKSKMGGDKIKIFAQRVDRLAKLCNPARLYAAYLIVAILLYYSVGGNLLEAHSSDTLAYVSCLAETCGLLLLRRNITRDQSVAGVSGNSMLVYFFTYVMRQYGFLPATFTRQSLDGWLTWILQMPQIALAGDIAHMVFVSKRATYQKDLDVLQARYLVLGCMCLAIPLHLTYLQGFWWSYYLGCYSWFSTLALLPQVLMMCKGKGKVKAPIAHFVASIVFVECCDLASDMDLVIHRLTQNQSVQYFVLGSFHFCGIFLLCDFTYYYLKARVSGSGLEQGLELPFGDDMC